MRQKPDINNSATEIVEDIQFNDLFNLVDIQRLQDLFSDANGVASVITHPDGTPITKPSNFCHLCIDIIRKTEKGLANCYQSDAELGRYNPSGPVVQPCLSGGLWDAGASITVDGKHIANWLIGQVRNEELDEQRMIQYADDIGANRADFLEALNHVPVMSVEQFNKVSKMLFAFANELSEKAYNNLLLKKQIAAREQAQEFADISNHQKKLILEVVGEGILGIDLAGNLTFVNPMAAEILGYEVEELPGKNSHQLFHHHHRDGAVYPPKDCPIYSTLQSGKTAYGEDYFWRKGGTGFPVGYSSLPIIENGKITGAVVSFRDITKHKQAEEALQKSAAQFHSLYMNMIDGVTLCELTYNDQGVPDDYVIIEINPAFEMRLGISGNSVIGMTGRKVFGVNEPPFLDIYTRVTLTGEPVTFETYFQPFAKHYSILIYSPYKGRLATIFKDITETRLAEKKIVDNNGRLESLVKILQYNSNQLKDFLDFALDELIRITGSKIGYIYFYDEEKQEFELNTWSKEVMKECAVANPKTIYSLDKTGLWGEAVRQRKPIINNNFEAEHPQKKGYPEGHVHLKKFLTIPVFFNNKIVAVAGVANKAEDYDPSDVLQMTIQMSEIWKTTERIKLELALQTSEEQWRTIVNTSPDGITTTTLDGIIKNASPKTITMWGYGSAEEIVGRSIFEFIDKTDHQKAKYRFGEMLKGNYMGPAEYLVKRKDGSRFYIEANAEVMRDEQGNPTSLLFVKRDITERKQAEEAMRDSERRYRLLIETVNEGILVSQNGFLEFVNPMMQVITGFTQEELLTLPFIDYVYPEDREIVMSNHLKRLKGEPFQPRYQFRIVKKDGSTKSIEMNGIVIEWEGQPATLNMLTDITERKQAEEEINLKNEQLLKLNAEKDKFFSIIAHDLRSPFNAFLGLTELMAEELPSLTIDQIQEFSIEMRKSASSLYRLLENLLQWSKMQQGLVPFNPELMPLNPLINECIVLTTEQAKNKGIEITYDIADDLKVFADSNMLQTVIRNLVSNAMKFTTKGGKISVSAIATDEKNVVISIQDTGIGMTSEMVTNLFRLDVNTNRKGTEGEPSSGLGLLLCKEFVEKQRGTIWVESEVGKGSAFKFTLPKGNPGQ